MYTEISITQLNDFIFCPASIYFHMLYGKTDNIRFQSEYQINGTAAHSAIDEKRYSERAEVICGMDVYCEEYGLIGKIDVYNTKTKVLTERKRLVKTIYDGYVFQVYAQCLALREMGYAVKSIIIHSMLDNKNYSIELPENDSAMFEKFRMTIDAMHRFDMDTFVQDNPMKCEKCIYEPACDRGLK